MPPKARQLGAIMSNIGESDGWAWFEASINEEVETEDHELCRSFARCFKDADGDLVVRHLKRIFLDRRLGASASDAELRYVEGQRSAIAHIISMAERGRS